MKFILTFATRYNGVSINLLNEEEDPPDELQKVFDEIGDALPGMTYEFVEKFDKSLTREQIQMLFDRAKEMLSDVVKEDMEFKFEYDNYSS